MNYPFELEPLPYSYDALEPYIDARTVELHHDKHQKTYVDNLNKLIEPYPVLHNKSLTELLGCIHVLPPQIREGVKNNAGGVYTHTLYWKGMCPGQNGFSDDLKEKLTMNFGSVENFKSDFKAAALQRFGSGWIWLVSDTKNNFKIISAPYTESPVYVGVTPVMILDVWEHAYYLKYQNRRGDYIDAWFNLACIIK